MRLRIIQKLGYLLILLAVLSCTDDKPTAPDISDLHYAKVYFTDVSSDSTFYSFDTDQMKLDSFYLPYRPERGMYLMDNKKDLVINFHDSVISVDLETKAVNHFPAGVKGPVVFSENEQYFAAPFNGTLRIYNTGDKSVFWEDTALTYGGCFSVGNDLYFSRYKNAVSVFDLKEKKLIKKSYLPNNIYEIKATLNDEVLLIHYFTDFDNIFQIYDLHLDTVLFSDTVDYGRGEIEISRNKMYAFFTYSGGIIQPDKNANILNGPTNTFRIYDLNSRSIYKIVNTEGFVPGDYYPFYAYYEIEQTANSKYLVGCQEAHNILVLFNLQTMELESYYKVGELGLAIYFITG